MLKQLLKPDLLQFVGHVRQPQALQTILGPIDAQDLAWIVLALIHESYGYGAESRDQRPVTRVISDLLENLGRQLLELTILESGWHTQGSTSVGEVARYLFRTHGPVCTELVVRFELSRYALLGKSLVKGTDPAALSKLLQSLALKLVGAIWVCRGYKAVSEIVSSSIASASTSHLPMDYKSILQEAVQRRKLPPPKYEIIIASGPDHAKQFRARVFTKDGRNAVGDGRSRKGAEQEAAKHYCETYGIKCSLSSKTPFAQNAVPVGKHFLHKDKGALEVLARTLSIPSTGLFLLDRALTHGSYGQKTGARGRDYQGLALIGSHVLASLAADSLMQFVLSEGAGDLSARAALSYAKTMRGVVETPAKVKGFDSLELRPLVLLGPSMGEQELLDTIKADILEAVLGATFLTQGELRPADDFLPTPLRQWLNERLQSIVSPHLGPKTELQELFQALGMSFQYSSQDFGLAQHEPIFRATLLIRSPILAKSILVRGGTGSSRKAAEASVASLMLTVSKVLSGGIEDGIANTIDVPERRSLAAFLVQHTFAVAPTSGKALLRWQTLGLLGSRLFQDGGYIALIRWAQDIEDLYSPTDGVSLFYERAIQFLQHSLSAPPSLLGDSVRCFLPSFGMFLENLDPRSPAQDVTQSKNFAELLALGKIAKLEAEPLRIVLLRELLDDFAMIAKGYPLDLTIHDGTSRDIEIIERRGTYLALITHALDTLAKDIQRGIRCYVSLAEKGDTVEFSFRTEPVDSYVSARAGFDEDLFLLHLKAIGIIVYWAVEDARLILRTWVGRGKRTFASRLMSRIVSLRTPPGAEIIALTELFHELKNELVAYQIARDMQAADLTSTLGQLALASRHLDNAKALYRVMENFGQTFSSPSLVPLDVPAFFRGYLAHKLGSLPTSISLELPSNRSTAEIWTSPDFLTSVMENLLNNAVEAMPNGGSIRVEWIYFDDDKLLVIEISDNGPGISEEVIAQFHAGRPARSEKRIGSGLGLLVARSLIERMGGRISLQSGKGKGTTWTIEVPNLHESTNPDQEGPSESR